MNEYRVETVQSGEEEDYLWVSLHFEPEDRIHIVCATSVDEQDVRLGMNALYLERLDQGQSGYGLSSRILVGPSSIDIELTTDGSRQLELPSLLHLQWSENLEGYRQAKQRLEEMSQYEWGRIVQSS